MASRESLLGLAGALRLLRLDAGGMACFTDSDAAIAQSFRVYLLVFPLSMAMSALLGDPALPLLGWPLYLALEGVKMAANVVGFLLVASHLALAMGHGRRIGLMVVAYNWSQLVSAAVYALFITISLGLSGGTEDGQRAVNGGLIVPMLWLLVYGWYVLRQSLACNGLLASVLLLADVTINLLINSVSTVAGG
jgi:hypothetical protein